MHQIKMVKHSGVEFMMNRKTSENKNACCLQVNIVNRTVQNHSNVGSHSNLYNLCGYVMVNSGLILGLLHSCVGNLENLINVIVHAL